jgi:hypothetical protein
MIGTWQAIRCGPGHTPVRRRRARPFECRALCSAPQDLPANLMSAPRISTRMSIRSSIIREVECCREPGKADLGFRENVSRIGSEAIRVVHAGAEVSQPESSRLGFPGD